MAEQPRLAGILSVLVTPLKEDETIDVPAYRALIRRVLDAGVHGVVVLGSAGEFAALRDTAKREAIAAAVKEVSGQVPVIVGTGEPGTRRAIEMTQAAKSLGADAALVVPPFYYRVDREGLLRHYRAVADEGGLPIMLYDIPAFTKTPLPVDVVAELAEEPNIVGIKDSTGNLRNFQALTAQARSETFTVVTGSDAMLLFELMSDGDGAVSPGSNIVPGWFVALWDAFHADRLDAASDWQSRIAAMHRGIGYGAFPAGIKGALKALGIGNGRLAAPGVGVTDKQLVAIRGWLGEHGVC